MTQADTLLSWRSRLGLSKPKAAAALGMSRTTYDAYESGKHKIPLYVLLACKCVLIGEPPIR